MKNKKLDITLLSYLTGFTVEEYEFSLKKQEIICANHTHYKIKYIPIKDYFNLKNSRPYQALILIVEDFIDKNTNQHTALDLEISFGSFKTKEQAELIARNATPFADNDLSIDDIKDLPTLARTHLRKRISKVLKITTFDKVNNSSSTYRILQNQVTFKKIKPEIAKKRRIKNDSDTPCDFLLKKSHYDIGIFTAGTTSHTPTIPSYRNTEAIEYNLNHFCSHYKENQKLQCVAYGTEFKPGTH